MDEPYGKLIEPPVLPFSFHAPGWYVLAAILLVLLMLWIRVMIRHYRLNAYRREGIRRIRTYEAHFPDPFLLLYHTNMLLKQIAGEHFGADETAGLRSWHWITFLNGSVGKHLFTTEDGTLLAGLYENNAQMTDVPLFIAKAKIWMSKHRRVTHAV